MLLAAAGSCSRAGHCVTGCPTDDLWAIDGTVLEQNDKRNLIWSGHRPVGAGTQLLYTS